MSRNKREGWYAGKLYGGHWRSRYFRSPWHYTAEMAPYMEAVRNAKGAKEGGAMGDDLKGGV